MPPARDRTFVGFGFGAIQGGLFLHEAFRSGSFRRLVVAEVLPAVVQALRKARGCFAVNTAYFDKVSAAMIGPVEIENPNCEPDRRRLVEAVAEADEIATAVPSVGFYAAPGPGSIHRILARGLQKKATGHGPRAIVYAAENNNHAAEILEARVLAEVPEAERSGVRSRVRFLNTVIGKMSGVVELQEDFKAHELAPVAATLERAFLVESFNRILISRFRFDDIAGVPPFRRAITVFEEKDDLIPFEEAKLYGHNATHALAAFVGSMRGIHLISDLSRHSDILDFLRRAFIRESGEALIRKHAGIDPLFTPGGYADYADDLLRRMTNPFLHDSVNRVGRDPERKLGWNDRLIGTMRVALSVGVTPRRYAFGAAASVAAIDRGVLSRNAPLSKLLESFWSNDSPEEREKKQVLALIEEGRRRLKLWLDSGFRNLESFFPAEHQLQS